MLRNKLSLTDILIGFESALKIDYRDKDLEEQVVNAIYRLEDAYGIKFSGDLYEDQLNNQQLGDTIDLLLSQVLDKMRSLALMMSLSLFDKRYGESLRSCNYLGFHDEELRQVLTYLQDEVLYEKRKYFFGQLIKAAAGIEISDTKRLLVTMAVLERLGIKEGVALIAQYLYLGI